MKFAPGVPDELQRIVDRALEKKREDRYRSVEEMLSDLRELAKDVEAQSRQGRPLVSGSGAAFESVEDTGARAVGAARTGETTTADGVTGRVARRKYAEAFEEYGRATLRLRAGNRSLNSRLAVAHAKAGQRDEARRLLEELLRSEEKGKEVAAAATYTALGDREQAFAWLDKSFEKRDTQLPRIKVEPHFKALRDDPRFAALVRRVGLEP